jgi:periplasmic divalent cation tolerance protein
MRLIYTTCPFAEEARSIGKKLIEEKLVACANYWQVQSLCVFEDTFKEKEETALILKVAKPRLDAVRNRIREMHSYTTPCILVLKPESVNHNFLQWVHDSCGVTTDEAAQNPE